MTDETNPYEPLEKPEQPEQREPPPARGWRSWSALQGTLVFVAGLLIVTGLVVAGSVLIFVVGLNQWASNK